VKAVDLPNVGLTLDNLQLHFMDVSNAEIVEKVSGIRSLSVEISDGFAAKPKNYLDWMINKRLMPGDGEFDITGFLGAVRDIGYRGPVSVEILNSYVRQFPLETAANMAYQKTRAALDAVS
jgi:4-hydroxyphenylpyruvate dioxygenase